MAACDCGKLYYALRTRRGQQVGRLAAALCESHVLAVLC